MIAENTRLGDEIYHAIGARTTADEDEFIRLEKACGNVAMRFLSSACMPIFWLIENSETPFSNLIPPWKRLMRPSSAMRVRSRRIVVGERR